MITNLTIIQSLLYLWHDAKLLQLNVLWKDGTEAEITLCCSLNPKEDRTPLTQNGVLTDSVEITLKDAISFQTNMHLFYTPSHTVDGIGIEAINNQSQDTSNNPLIQECLQFKVILTNGSIITVQCASIVITD